MSYLSTYILFHQSPALILSCHEYSMLDITYCITTCSCMLMLTTRFLMHVYDSDLLIHVCLSMHATWHSYHHSPGSFDSPGSSCPGLGACGFSQLLIRVAQLKRDPQQTVQSPILLGPLCVSQVFLMKTHERHLYCSYLYSPFVFSHLRLSVM